MKPTSKDRDTIEAIKRLLDDPATTEDVRSELREEWMSIGNGYAWPSIFAGDPEHDDWLLSRRSGNVLVRHSESEGNIGLPTASPASIVLTQRGHQQAETLAKLVVEVPDMIVVSPFIRTQQTAAPLMGRCPEVRVEIWDVQEYTYLNPLKYVGTTENERGVFARSHWERCDPLWNDGGGAESFVEFIARVDTALSRLRSAEGQWTMVFSHGYFIKAAELRMRDPAAPVDATLMARFGSARKQGVPGNCEWIKVS